MAVAGTPDAGGTETANPNVPPTTAPRGSRPAPGATSGNGASSGQSESAGASVPQSGPKAPLPGAAPAAQPATAKSPVKVGHAGTLSGPVGSVTITMQQGVQLWVQLVNSRGGVNGHPVQLIVADDGGDPARHTAQMKELVEKYRVVAFVNNPEVLTGQASVNYVNQVRVPVIGMTGAEPWAARSPMHFPQVSTGEAFSEALYGSMGAQALDRDKRKLGVLACTELQQCQDLFDQADHMAPKRGLDVAFKVRASLAQPDFTAECLAARNAGVEVYFIILDGNSLRRVAASCARQGFHPLFATGAQVLTHDHKDDPNLDNLLISNATSFPYFWDSPTTAEFRQAFQAYGRGMKPSGGQVTGWVSGKLFERAAAALPEPPTASAILTGLWSMKQDDLGGLTAPLTFIQDKPAPQAVCWWNISVIQGAWTSFDNFNRHCD